MYPQTLPVNSLQILVRAVRGEAVDKADVIAAAYEVLGFGLGTAFGSGRQLIGSSYLTIQEENVGLPKQQIANELEKLIKSSQEPVQQEQGSAPKQVPVEQEQEPAQDDAHTVKPSQMTLEQAREQEQAQGFAQFTVPPWLIAFALRLLEEYLKNK